MKSNLNPDQEPICDEKPCRCDDDDIIRDQTHIDDHFKLSKIFKFISCGQFRNPGGKKNI